jgi:hypothetical protein
MNNTCDVTSVHDFAKEISEIFPRNSIVRFQVVVEDVHAYDQVTGVERVGLVPTLEKVCFKISNLDIFLVSIFVIDYTCTQESQDTKKCKSIIYFYLINKKVYFNQPS